MSQLCFGVEVKVLGEDSVKLGVMVCVMNCFSSEFVNVNFCICNINKLTKKQNIQCVIYHNSSLKLNVEHSQIYQS